MVSNSSEQYAERAIRHEARAQNYRRKADLLLNRDADTDCAAALIYESAKQYINAVANQRGSNPGTTSGKVNVVRELASIDHSSDLMENWQSADKLHIYADRGHLTTAEFNGYWNDAQAFIDSMLDIYNRNA